MNPIAAQLGGSAYQSLLESAVSLPAGSRLGTALQRSPLRIAFLGGSVTYGYRPSNPDHKGGYAELIAQDLTQLHPDASVCFRNYGISGTSHLIGSILTELHLTDFAPHIVFVEYAINETFDRTGVQKTEGLIQKLLALPSAPAVILLSVVSQQGYSCEGYYEQLAAAYRLPMIGLQRSLFARVQSGALSWSAYAEDGGHPIDAGHRLIADAAALLFSKAAAAQDAPDPPSFTPNAFARMRPVAPASVTATGFARTEYPLHHFPAVWKTTGDGSAVLSTELVCSLIALVFVQDSHSDFGSLSVEIDGREAALLQGQSMFGWHNPVTELVLHTAAAVPHRLVLRRPAADSSKTFLLQEIAADHI